ncbi:MAG TPA: ABC transporter substrate-binding protein [Acidimicrobiales bacterium]|nr:ABC transporter substrate-binding protein [Acidimicrobiales bacterium]
MQLKTKLRLLVALGTAAASLSLGLIAVTESAGAASTASNTISFAEAPGGFPNYIFPYMSCKYFSVDNTQAFQYEMFRPVYWFGLGTTTVVQPKLSLAAMPAMSNGNKTVTINMKGWKFADGQTIDAQSVMFYLNMYKADPTSYCGYNAGYGIPDQVTSASGKGNTVTIKFKTSVNPNWILYNYLSELTPMPNSWDITAPGKTSTCATGAYGATSTTTACKAVEKYLDAQASKISTYTDTMWQSGVSGPWKLTSIDDLGNVTLEANNAYSGPQKAQVKYVKELAYTSAAAEQEALRAGSVDIGYVDNSVLTSDGTPNKPGANWSAIASNYNLVVGAPWSVDYAAYNFNKKSPDSVFLDQLYIRQAIQMTVDQKAMIKKIYKGDGYVQINPMPPVTPAAIAGGASTKNPYPYNPTKAKKLLTSHGWVDKGGVDVCEKPGSGATDCGPGIKSGQKLAVTLEYGSGLPALLLQVTTEVSEWKTIGISASTLAEPFDSVVSDCVGNPANWSICLWGAGWIYSPDYYPSGESLFVPGASFNIGLFSNAALTSAVKASTFGTATLATFANDAAKDLPDLYQPNTTDNFAAGGIGEVIKTLKSKIGFTPNPLENFMPEYYSLK